MELSWVALPFPGAWLMARRGCRTAASQMCQIVSVGPCLKVDFATRCQLQADLGRFCRMDFHSMFTFLGLSAS